MLDELVRERGGVACRSPDELAAAAPARFAALIVADDRLLPALARLAEGRYLLKQGLVGGPEGEPGARSVEPELVARVLDLALAGEVEWERDPDFGYDVAAVVPGVGPPDDGLLLPRLLYARNGRVYEHAALVPGYRSERAAILPAGATGDG